MRRVLLILSLLATAPAWGQGISGNGGTGIGGNTGGGGGGSPAGSVGAIQTKASSTAFGVAPTTGTNSVVLSTSPTIATPTITGVTTATGGVTITGDALNFSGVGAGHASGTGFIGAVMDNEVAYNFPTATFVRNRYWFDTITANTNTSQIDEGFFFGRQVSGTATLTGEINGIHSFLQSLPGPTFNNSWENFEASASWNAVHSSVSSYIALPDFSATGSLVPSTGAVYGYAYGLTNRNPAAASIPISIGFFCKAPTLIGGGTAPVNDLCLQNTNPNGGISTAGRVSVGNQGSPPTNAMITVSSPNQLSSNFGILIRDNTSTTVFDAANNGNVFGAGTANFNALTIASITGSTQCLHVNSLGAVAGTGVDCGAGGGSIAVTDGTTTVSPSTTVSFPAGTVTNAGGGTATVSAVKTIVYTGAGTYGATPPATAQLIRFIVQGQGGCGGAGAGITTPFTGAGGGAGGGAQPKDTGWFPTSLVSGAYAITIQAQCTAAAGGGIGANGANGGAGGQAQMTMTGMEGIFAYGGGGGAGAIGGAGATATGGGGGAGMYAAGVSTTNGTGGAGGSQNGGAGGSGTAATQVTLSGGSSGGAGSAATGAGSNSRFVPGGSGGGASGGGCNTGTPAAGGAGIGVMNGSAFGTAGTAGGATGGNGGVGAPSLGTVATLGAGGGGGGGGGTTAGGVGGNGGLAGGGGGGGGSGCGASATGGNGGVGGAAQVIVMYM